MAHPIGHIANRSLGYIAGQQSRHQPNGSLPPSPADSGVSDVDPSSSSHNSDDENRLHRHRHAMQGRHPELSSPSHLNQHQSQAGNNRYPDIPYPFLQRQPSHFPRTSVADHLQSIWTPSSSSSSGGSFTTPSPPDHVTNAANSPNLHTLFSSTPLLAAAGANAAVTAALALSAQHPPMPPPGPQPS